MSDDPMRILVVEPTKDPYVKEIDGSLASMQAIVGGYIQAVEPFDDPNVLLLCNEEAKLLGLPENRFLRNRNGIPYDIIHGTFFLAQGSGEEFCSLTDKQIQTYTRLYSREKLFVMQHGKVINQPKKEHRRMKDKYLLTAESVTAGHPDKLCDTIADNVLDACLKEDPNARVACEVLATAGKILVAGELRTTASPDVETIVRQTVQRAGYDCNYHVEVRLHTQSPDIAGAVDGDTLGAGDQGIMYGYACWETVELLPAPVVLANRITSLLTTCREENLISGIGPDGKAQVSVQYAFGVPERVDTIVISCQHDADNDPDELREELRRLVIDRACHDVRIDEQTKILINPSGRFMLGGFEADTGLTGRKLMVDTYGGLVPHGGGALSGKDGTKVDRSGAYMARYVAKNIVAAGLADVCTVSLAYAIGQAEPVAVEIDTQESGYYDDAFLTEAVRRVFDFTPAGMIHALDLDKPFFADVCNNCHFMHPQTAWEQTDKVEKLRMACAELEDERT